MRVHITGGDPTDGWVGGLMLTGQQAWDGILQLHRANSWGLGFTDNQ